MAFVATKSFPSNAGHIALKDRLEKEFLPFVIKPGRYIGNELHSVQKSPEMPVRFCLSFPDVYELGMSYLGLGILYYLINRLDYAWAERCYAPWLDAEQLLRQKRIPLFSLESATPLKDFDVVGFSISYELTYSNMLTMLDLAGIPIHSRNRNEADPIIMAGGSAVVNPEPIAEFIDLFVLGDAEEIISQICEIIRDRKKTGVTRREIIESLARLRGVYYPAGYQCEYDQNHRFQALAPSYPWLPNKIPVLVVSDLKSDYFPDKPLVPFIEITHDRLAIEIMRGCVRNCRFCQAGQTYLPRRNRSVDDLLLQAINGIRQTGWDEITLLSLSSSDYPQIGELARRLTTSLSSNGVAISLPSLRPGTFTMELANLISRTRKTGLTFAPEGGTFRIRWVIHKRLLDEELFETCRIAFNSGWNLIKLYYMIGLPTETQEDLFGILQMIHEVMRIGKQSGAHKQLNVTISPFCPKPHTAFQWERQCEPEEIYQKENFLRLNNRLRGVNLKFRNPLVAYLEGILGRGDRKLSNVIYQAWQNGARFDAWSDCFNYTMWEDAFVRCGTDPKFYTAALDLNNPLPWDHIDKGDTRARLLKERENSLATTWETVAPFLKEPTPGPENTRIKLEESPQPEADILSPDLPLENSNTDSVRYGRSKRKVRATLAGQIARSHIRMCWTKGPEVRFISHLDCMRAIERAIRRAEIPVAYSEGFHPHQKVSFGPPLPLGFISEAEYFDIQLTEPYSSSIFESLKRALPPGFGLKATKLILDRTVSLSSAINMARYEVGLEHSQIVNNSQSNQPIDQLQKIQQIMDSRSWLVRRTQKSKVQNRGEGNQTIEVNIRPYIYELRLSGTCSELLQRNSYVRGERGRDLPVLSMLVGLGNQGYAKPQEILRYGLGFTEAEVARALICRTNLYINQNERLLSPLETI